MGLFDLFKRGGSAAPTSGRKTGAVGNKLQQGILSKQQSPPRDLEGFLAAYGSHPQMRAVVSKIAYAEASTRWKVVGIKGPKGAEGKSFYKSPVARYRTQEMRRKAMADLETQEFADHPLPALLSNPCPLFPGIDASMLWSAYLLIAGEAFQIIERQGKMPVALYPIPPHWVTRTPSAASPEFEIKVGNFRQTFKVSDVLWDRELDLVFPYGRGSGLMRTLGDELDASEYGSKLVNYQFYNMNRPDLLVTIEGMDDDKLRAFKDAWSGALQGVRNFARTFFTNLPVSVEPIQTDFVHNQVGEMMKWLRDVVHQVPGVPPEILGILDSSNKATITAAEYIFAKHVVVPRLERRREFLQHQMVPMFDERIMLEYESPVPRDKAEQLAAFTAGPIGPTLNDWRELMGLDPLEEPAGKMYVVSNPQAYLVEDLEALTEQPAQPAFGGEFGGEEPPPEEEPVEPEPEEPEPEEEPPITEEEPKAAVALVTKEKAAWLQQAGLLS